MEPLDQTGAAEESVLSQQEAVVVAIRSTMKELQESVQDICKANLTKIATLGKHSSPLPFLFLALQLVKTFLFFLVNHDPVALVTNGAAETSPDGQLTSQNTGTVSLPSFDCYLLISVCLF